MWQNRYLGYLILQRLLPRYEISLFTGIRTRLLKRKLKTYKYKCKEVCERTMTSNSQLINGICFTWRER